MAAHSCCADDVDAAITAARARRRVKLMRRRKLLRPQQLAGGKRAPSAQSRKKRVLAIRRKVESLRRLVAPAVCRGGDGPGGERLDELLLHAAGYIMRLQMQVRVMQVMVHALNNSED